MKSRNRELSAAEVAVELGVSPAHAAQLMRAGDLAARQLGSGVWLTSPSALDVYRATRRQGRGRSLDPASAWGVLWELSGLRATWLDASTRSRLRGRIAEWGPEDIVQAVSGRTRETRYSSVGRGASDEVILTGLSVAGVLNAGLRNKPSELTGYPRHIAPAEHAERWNMVPDYEGKHALYENTLPIPNDLPRMPVAVIAADLARSPNPLTRKVALRALEKIWDDWAASS